MRFSLTAFITLLPALASAHGYLCSPPPRGIEKEAYNVDALKSPNFSQQPCRGEGPGQITQVQPGGDITLGFKITAPHIGPCEVYLLDLDLDLSKQVKIAEKRDCAAPGKVGPWTVHLPPDITGRKVLRWYWEGQHIGTPGEPYEQCVDLMIGGGGGGDYDDGGKANKRAAGPALRGGRAAAHNQGQPMPPAPPRQQPPPPPASVTEPEMGAYVPGSSFDEPEAAYGSEDEDVYVSAQSYGGGDDGASDSDYVDDTGYGDEEQEKEEAYGDESGCQHGQYVCDQDGDFFICNNNARIRQSCGAGQVCVPFNGSILCVQASQAGAY